MRNDRIGKQQWPPGMCPAATTILMPRPWLLASGAPQGSTDMSKPTKSAQKAKSTSNGQPASNGKTTGNDQPASNDKSARQARLKAEAKAVKASVNGTIQGLAGKYKVEAERQRKYGEPTFQRDKARENLVTDPTYVDVREDDDVYLAIRSWHHAVCRRVPTSARLPAVAVLAYLDFRFCADKTGQPYAKSERDGYLWWRGGYGQICQFTGLTIKQARGGVATLIKLGVLLTWQNEYDSQGWTWFRLDWDEIGERLHEAGWSPRRR